MTIFSKTVKLAGLDPKTFTPEKTGVDIIWKRYNSDLYATFTAGNLNNELNLTEKHDINRQLSKLKVIQDTIKDYPTYRKVVPTNPVRQVWHDNGNRVVLDK